MSEPRLLDLFCGAGGCSVGYARAGFDVTGVDLEDHPSYPFELIRADAREVLTDVGFLQSFDVLAGSPPCQELTRARHLRDAQGGKLKEHGVNLIPETRACTGTPAWSVWIGSDGQVTAASLLTTTGATETGAGARLRVLVTERAVRALATAAEERP